MTVSRAGWRHGVAMLDEHYQHVATELEATVQADVVPLKSTRVQRPQHVKPKFISNLATLHGGDEAPTHERVSTTSTPSMVSRPIVWPDKTDTGLVVVCAEEDRRWGLLRVEGGAFPCLPVSCRRRCDAQKRGIV